MFKLLLLAWLCVPQDICSKAVLVLGNWKESFIDLHTPSLKIFETRHCGTGLQSWFLEGRDRQ